MEATTTINTLSAAQIVERTAAMMNKSKGVLIEKAALVGIDTTGMSKKAIVTAIIERSGSIQSAPKAFDYSGLFIRI